MNFEVIVKKTKLDYKDLAYRLAEYHKCRIEKRYVREKIGKESLVFVFPCGNGFSFDTDKYMDPKNIFPFKTLTYKLLIEKYLARYIFVFRTNDNWCEGWNEFPKQIITADSAEELSLKLASFGF